MLCDIFALHDFFFKNIVLCDISDSKIVCPFMGHYTSSSTGLLMCCHDGCSGDGIEQIRYDTVD